MNAVIFSRENRTLETRSLSPPSTESEVKVNKRREELIWSINLTARDRNIVLSDVFVSLVCRPSEEHRGPLVQTSSHSCRLPLSLPFSPSLIPSLCLLCECILFRTLPHLFSSLVFSHSYFFHLSTKEFRDGNFFYFLSPSLSPCAL